MSALNLRAGKWPVPRRARVRVRVGGYVVVGRFARVAPRAAGPPGSTVHWGPAVAQGRVGYGALSADGRIEYWRPLPPLS